MDRFRTRPPLHASLGVLVERRLGLHAVKSTIVRIRKHFQSPGPATIRGCDVADYEIDGDDVTRKVTNGGYSMTGLEVGDTTIDVTVRGVPWSVGCAIKVAANGRVHDALTLRFIN